MDFFEVLDAGFQFGTGGDVEAGRIDDVEGLGGILDADASREDDGEVGVFLDEDAGQFPVGETPGAAVFALGEAVDQDAAGIILEDAGDVLGGFEADRFDEGVVCFRKLEAVVDILVTVKLSHVNDLVLKKLEREFGGGIDEDPDP